MRISHSAVIKFGCRIETHRSDRLSSTKSSFGQLLLTCPRPIRPPSFGESVKYALFRSTGSFAHVRGPGRACSGRTYPRCVCDDYRDLEYVGYRSESDSEMFLFRSPGRRFESMRYRRHRWSSGLRDPRCSADHAIGSTIVGPVKVAFRPPLYAHYAYAEHSDDALIISVH